MEHKGLDVGLPCLCKGQKGVRWMRQLRWNHFTRFNSTGEPFFAVRKSQCSQRHPLLLPPCLLSVVISQNYRPSYCHSRKSPRGLVLPASPPSSPPLSCSPQPFSNHHPPRGSCQNLGNPLDSCLSLLPDIQFSRPCLFTSKPPHPFLPPYFLTMHMRLPPLS